MKILSNRLYERHGKDSALSQWKRSGEDQRNSFQRHKIVYSASDKNRNWNESWMLCQIQFSIFTFLQKHEDWILCSELTGKGNICFGFSICFSSDIRNSKIK
jgi:hypothetical protein